MDLTGSFPVLTDEEYEQALHDFCLWRGTWPPEIAKGGPSEIFILTKNDRVRWNDGTGSVKFDRVRRPDKALVSALVALVTKYGNASGVVVLIKRLEGETNGVIVPLWWEIECPYRVLTPSSKYKRIRREKMGHRNFMDPSRVTTPPLMEDGKWYDLDPPANIKGKVFRRVCCDYRVPNQLQEYAVRGTPDGGDTEEPFILRFSDRGRVRITPSADQSGE